MKKENINIVAKGYALLQVIICVITYGIVTKLIFGQVEEKFRYMMDENNIVRTLRNYQLYILYCVAAAVFFTIIWWFLAKVGIGGIRTFYEQNTFAIAIVFCMVLFVVISILRIRNGQIVDDQGEAYQLYYSYAIGCTFVFNMYGFPPDTVENVIFFGQRVGRFIVSGIMILFVIFILFKGEGL